MPEAIKPVIEKVTIPEIFPSMAARDWARITGEEPGYQARSFYYRTTRNGQEYQEIVGGFVPPALNPGFAVVVGLGRQDDSQIEPAWNLGTRRITVLAEVESEGLTELMAGALMLRKLYAPALDKGFYCDPDGALIFRIAQIMEKLETEPPFVLLPGIYFEQASAFRDYVATLTLYRRVLDRGNCEKLRAHMDNFPKEALVSTEKKAWEDYPAVTALAYAVHGLMVNPMLDLGEGAIEDENETA
jgi:hypothetical protein